MCNESNSRAWTINELLIESKPRIINKLLTFER